MQNRDAFLAEIAHQLGRDVRQVPLPLPGSPNDHARTRLTELSLQQRCDAFIDTARHVMLAHCELTRAADAAQAALDLCDRYGHAPVLLSGDSRLAQWGIAERLQRECQAAIWDPTRAEQSLRLAEQAKIGVLFADYGLTESGGVVLFSRPECGRAVSLLPESSLFVLRKSTLLPRVAQLAEHLQQRAQQGQRMPSCINLISGPSSTADIELIKVVGVHGPVNAIYLIIEDD